MTVGVFQEFWVDSNHDPHPLSDGAALDLLCSCCYSCGAVRSL